jgi:alpha-N-arabinofuranosidase
MATITVDLNRPLGTVSRFVFGQFIEHMHRCLYGGIYEEDSALSDERGFRLDVLEAARDLHPPILRWPGGNFVSGYHWEDGIGPRDRRPSRMELAWGGIESNCFGTDEFITYCRELGTEPYICVNLGTGTLDEARNWVEYCNGTKDTYYANLRRQYGHPEPYKVKYWGLGNEMYGAWQQGAKTAQEYAVYAREAGKLMKAVDPSIKLVACGHSGISDWDRIVVETLAPLVDYVAIHIYTGSEDYYTNAFLPHHAGRCIRQLAALIERVRFQQGIEHPILIAYDEWNVWTHGRATADNGYEQPYELADALAVATYLNTFLRDSRVVGMANLAQMVNVLGAIITRSDGLYPQTIYHPLRLYAEQCGPLAVDSYVASTSEELYVYDPDAPLPDKRLADLGPFPYLDVAATADPKAHKLTLCVVNRHMESDLPADLVLLGGQVMGEGKRYEINGARVTTRNSFDEPAAVSVRQDNYRANGSQFSYRFPAHSVTALILTYQ